MLRSLRAFERALLRKGKAKVDEIYIDGSGSALVDLYLSPVRQRLVKYKIPDFHAHISIIISVQIPCLIDSDTL